MNDTNLTEFETLNELDFENIEDFYRKNLFPLPTWNPIWDLANPSDPEPLYFDTLPKQANRDFYFCPEVD